MTAKEFLKQISPNDKSGIRADLKAAKLEKHIIDIMERYAALRQPPLSHDKMREPIEDALYATKHFLTSQATDLAEDILKYIKDAGYIIVSNNNPPTP